MLICNGCDRRGEVIPPDVYTNCRHVAKDLRPLWPCGALVASPHGSFNCRAAGAKSEKALTKLWNFPFPGLLVSNKNQFDDYRRSHSNLLDYRYALELKLSNTGGKPVRIEGICPLTQMHTTFVSTIPAEDKRVTPDWREQQFDDRGVGMGDRAVAHFAL